MSFRVDLWNGLDLIKSQFNLTLNKTSILSSILLSYAHCQKAHYKNLESLYKENKDKDIFESDYLLDKSLKDFIENFKTESEFYKQHYKYIKENIIVSLKEISEKEKATFNNIYNEGIQKQEEFLKIKNNLINKQNEYTNSIKDFYDFISDFDDNEILSVLKGTSLGDNQIDKRFLKTHTHTKSTGDLINMLTNDVNKLDNPDIIKRDKMIEKINVKKNNYSSLINESNKFLYSYKNKLEAILQSLEENYQCLINNIHSTLFSTNQQRIHLINNINLLNNNFLKNDLNKINTKKELREFITKNVTKEFPIYKFELFTYKINDSKILCIDINRYIQEKIDGDVNLSQEEKSRKKTEVRLFRSKSIRKKRREKNENSLFEDNKIKLNICLMEDFIDELFINKGETEKKDLNNDSYNDSSSKMIDINNIKSLLDKSNQNHPVYLEALIKALNNSRAKGNFSLNKKSYDILIEIFNFILDNYSTNDYILKNIVILAQTFYMLNNNKNSVKKNDPNNINDRLFIQNGLRNKPIFNNAETWHRAINYTLANNSFNKELSHIFDKNESNKRISMIIYNTLIAYLCDIKYFTDDENIYNEIKNFYTRVYQIDEDLLNKEVNNITNVEPPKPKKKVVTFLKKK